MYSNKEVVETFTKISTVEGFGRIGIFYVCPGTFKCKVDCLLVIELLGEAHDAGIDKDI